MLARVVTRLAAAGSVGLLAGGLWMAWPPAAPIAVGTIGAVLCGIRMGSGG